MKYHLISASRSLGLLPVLDRLSYLRKRAQTARSNRAFRAAHPGYAVPPEDLAFDAYNKVDWESYDTLGRAHARVFAELIDAHAPAGPLSLLEWGCGPGRLIRHMPALLAHHDVAVTGTDYNPDTIRWCKDALPGIDFALNGMAPPLPFDADSFGAAYNFSVFTHLSEAVQIAWAQEMLRVLKPGGVLVATTHGDYYTYLLTGAVEQAAYARGELVTQSRYAEGKKWFFAVHPPDYVRAVLFKGFERVERVATPADAGMTQDVWIGFKPHG